MYTYIFEREVCLNAIYDNMKKHINEDCNNKFIKLYPLYGKPLKESNIKLDNLSNQNLIYAGLDLPVWQNDPKNAKIRIMVISQDPRRSNKEMEQNDMERPPVISISTPFGLHSKKWRSHKSKGLVHYLFDDLKKDYRNNPEELSIYYTDIYKLRGVESVLIDAANYDVYKEVLIKEMELFSPNVILLLGNAAQNAWCKNEYSPEHVICVPHPNARPDTWRNKYSIKTSISSEKKREVILEELKEKIKSLNL